MTNKGILSINAQEPHEIIMSLSVIEGKIEGGIICPPHTYNLIRCKMGHDL